MSILSPTTPGSPCFTAIRISTWISVSCDSLNTFKPLGEDLVRPRVGFDHDQSSTAKRNCHDGAGNRKETPTAGFRQTVLEPFLVFLRLGLTSFGGPIAHLGYFRQEFVERRKWLSEPTFADLVALCNFLPGPTSSQVCYSIGMTRGGIPGAISAWSAFTIPSAIIMLLAAYGIHWLSGEQGASWLTA
jgi:hypothetical protein